MLTEVDDQMLANFHTYDGDKKALFAAIAYKADVITYRELQSYISSETDASGSPTAINELLQDLVDLCK